MGESSCIEASFSHGPETSNGEGEVNMASALRDSVSFGRFMSESLDWGKWSSFHHNRNLEEVGKYSTPGSVAQKKAYFEAHYKRIAAMKAAALEKQVNDADGAERENNSTIADDGSHIFYDSRTGPEELSSEMALSEAAEVERPIGVTSCSPGANESNLGEENRMPEMREEEKSSTRIENENLAVPPLKNESTEIVEDAENETKNTEAALSRTAPLEMQALKESSVINENHKESATEKPRIPDSKLTGHRPSRLPPSSKFKLPLFPAKPASSVNLLKGSKSSPGSKKCGTVSNDGNKPTSRSLHTSINSTQYQGGTSSSETNTVEKGGSLEEVRNSPKASQKYLYPINTLIKAPSIGLPSIGLPSNGLQAPSIGLPSNGLPSNGLQAPSIGLPSIGLPSNGLQAKPSNGLPSNVLQAPSIGLPSIGLPSIGLPSNGLQAPSNGLPSRTPQLEKGRTKSPSQRILNGRRKIDAELLPVGCLKSPRRKGAEACTQIISPSVRFRTEERAEKRKESLLNLEEKSDAKEAKKQQIQGSSKSKESGKWHKRLYPYFTTLQEFYDGKNAEQRRSRVLGDHGAPSVQSLSSSPSLIPRPCYPFRKPHNDLEGLQPKDPENQTIDPTEIHTVEQPLLASSSRQVKSIPAPDHDLTKNAISNKDDKNVFRNAYISMREKPKRSVEARMRGRQCANPYSINKCITTFNQMHGFTPEEMVKATKVFKDASNREVFLSLEEDQREFWLKAMIDEL